MLALGPHEQQRKQVEVDKISTWTQPTRVSSHCVHINHILCVNFVYVGRAFFRQTRTGGSDNGGGLFKE